MERAFAALTTRILATQTPHATSATRPQGPDSSALKEQRTCVGRIEALILEAASATNANTAELQTPPIGRYAGPTLLNVVGQHGVAPSPRACYAMTLGPYHLASNTSMVSDACVATLHVRHVIGLPEEPLLNPIIAIDVIPKAGREAASPFDGRD